LIMYSVMVIQVFMLMEYDSGLEELPVIDIADSHACYIFRYYNRMLIRE